MNIKDVILYGVMFAGASAQAFYITAVSLDKEWENQQMIIERYVGDEYNRSDIYYK